jgi:hypothetical protein
MNKISGFVKKFDKAGHPASFRYDEKLNYKSATGGICSIIVIVILFFILVIGLVGVFNKTIIRSSQPKVHKANVTYSK